MLVCKNVGCPYCVENFCSSKVTVINEDGCCSHIFKHYDGGSVPKPNRYDPVDISLKKMPIIIERKN